MASVSTSQMAGRSAALRVLRPCATPSRVFGVAALPPRPVAIHRTTAQAEQSESSVNSNVQEQVVRAAAWSTAAGTMMAAGHAQAASEIAELAASDNRVAIIATLFLPVVGWVLFNIGGPALNQLANAAEKNKSTKGVSKALRGKGGTKKRAAIGVITGLSAASLLAAPQADAAQELMQLAASDNRIGIIATLFLPVVGWVLFNIGGPALNQLANTGKNASRR